jgi:L-lactate dehydrogenase (cytochrome)
MIATFRSVVRFRTPTLNPVQRRLERCVSVEDMRAIAKRRLPHGVFDYIDGGAEDERSLGRNSASFAQYEFQPRVLRDVSNLDTSTTLFGRPMSMPVILAPTGYSRIADSQGELAVARAAARADVPYSLSTMGTRSIEEVAAVSDGDKWFQIYTWRDRPLVEELIGRAKDAGYTTVWLTVDTAVLGRRERDVRRGFTLPPKIGPSTLIDGALHPGWTIDFLRNEPITFANVVGRHEMDGSTAISLAEKVANHFDQSLSWNDIDWLRSIWDGPIVLKGIQTVADAKQAARWVCRASACRTTAAVNSTMPRCRFISSSRCATRSVTPPRSSVTAGYAGGATSSRRLHSAPMRCRSDGPTCTHSALPGSAVSTTCWTSCATA